MYVYRFVKSKNSKKSIPLYLILLFVCVFGFVLGVFLFLKFSVNFLKGIDFLFFSYYETRVSASFIEVFLKSYSSIGFILLICGFLGFSAPGAYVLPCFLFLKSFVLGADSAYLCLNFGFQGALWNLIAVLPGVYGAYFLILSAARESMNFSKKICNAVFCHRELTTAEIRFFLKKLILYLSMAVFPAVVDGILSVLFRFILT